MTRHRIYFLVLTLLSLAAGSACIGGGGLGGGSGIGGSNGSAPGGLPAGNGPAAAAPDVMGPKADDTQTNDDEWTEPAVLSQGQRLRYGPAPQNAAVVDPNADPITFSLPSGGSLSLLVEISLDGTAWRSDLAGPYVRIVYLPLDSNGQLSLNGSFRDIKLKDKNAQGWNAVFDGLTLPPGEISVWYYERAETPVTKQNWNDAFFFPPPLNISPIEEMAPINFSDFWNFAAEPFTRHLGRFRQTTPVYRTQPPHQNYSATPP